MCCFNQAFYFVYENVLKKIEGKSFNPPNSSWLVYMVYTQKTASQKKAKMNKTRRNQSVKILSFYTKHNLNWIQPLFVPTMSGVPFLIFRIKGIILYNILRRHHINRKYCVFKKSCFIYIHIYLLFWLPGWKFLKIFDITYTFTWSFIFHNYNEWVAAKSIRSDLMHFFLTLPKVIKTFSRNIVIFFGKLSGVYNTYSSTTSKKNAMLFYLLDV